MLRLVKPTIGYRLEASDEMLGSVKDFLFDEEHWAVRHIVVDTGHWLPGRKVLVSPVSIKSVDWAASTFNVCMTQEDVKKAPELDEDAPVSREYERRWYTAYKVPYYWGHPGVWGGGIYPINLLDQEPPDQKEKEKESPENKERVLRSANELRGYHVQASDGAIGHIHDFIFDDETWIIRYLVIDTRNWLPGKKVLLAPGWITAVHWAERDVTTSLSRDAVENSPEFDPTVPVNREYEKQLYDYYGRPVYWGK